MLCLMFECSPRGVLITGSSPWSRDDVAAAVGGNKDVARVAIDECVAKGVCGVREDGALFSRRMVREETRRELNVKRVRSHREKRQCNGDVTPIYEEEDEKEDHQDLKPKQKHSGAEEIYALYPRKVGRVSAIKSIIAVLAASGPEMKLRLMERTLAYAEAVKKWPVGQLHFVPHPATWYNRGSFDDDPSTWVREHPNQTVPWQRDSHAGDHTKGF